MTSERRSGEATARSDRREQLADAREAVADEREQHADVREAVLDRWERTLTERATALGLLDDGEEQSRHLAAGQRAADRSERRAAADVRRDAAIERAADRITHAADAAVSDSAALQQAGDRTLKRLLDLIRSGSSLAESLIAVLDIAADVFVDAAAITISLSIDGKLTPAASTAAWAADVDAVQLRNQRGPILDAAAAETVVVSGNLAADAR